MAELCDTDIVHKKQKERLEILSFVFSIFPLYRATPIMVMKAGTVHQWKYQQSASVHQYDEC